MRVVVLGAGAMGCLYGGSIKEAGYDVTLVDVWQEHVDTINREGLTLEIDGVEKVVQLTALQAEELRGVADVLVVFTKSIHTLNALATIKSAITDTTIALTLQNGLGNIEKIEQYIPRSRIVVGVTNIPADLRGPGRVHSTGAGYNQILSALGEVTPAVDSVQDMLLKAGLNVRISPDVFKAIWEKVAFNAAVNSIAATLKLSMDQIGKNPDSHDLAFTIAKEAIAVANAKGINASEENVLNMLEDGFEHHIGHLPSMLQDVLAKRLTEVEAINGGVAAEGKAAGVPTPVTTTLYKLVRTIQSTYPVQVERE